MPTERSAGRKLPDPHARGAQGRTALHRAAREGKLELIRELLAIGADIHASDAAGEQALQMAARKGHLDSVKLLISAGANVNHIPQAEVTEYSESALCSAVRKYYNLECVEITAALLKAGADPNLMGGNSDLPLHAAAASENPKLVSLLLDSGARLDIRDSFGRLPLHCALETDKDNVDIASLLLAKGANVDAPDAEGRAPIFSAVLKADRAPKQFRAVLEAKPSLNVVDPDFEMTALQFALASGPKSAVRLLREAGAEDPPRDSDESVITVEIDLDEAEIAALSAEQTDDDQESEEEDESEEEAPDTDAPRYGDDPVGLPEDFDWRSSGSHIHYLAYLKQPKPPYYENWLNLAGESGQDAVRRFLREGALMLCDDAIRGAFKYTISDLKKMVTKAGAKPKEKKADLLAQARQVAPAIFVAGIRNMEMYELTEAGRTAVTAFRAKAVAEGLRTGEPVPDHWLRDFRTLSHRLSPLSDRQ